MPLTGFGFLLQKGALEAIKNEGPIGILTGPLKLAGILKQKRGELYIANNIIKHYV